jgi:hypothetical protein
MSRPQRVAGVALAVAALLALGGCASAGRKAEPERRTDRPAPSADAEARSAPRPRERVAPEPGRRTVEDVMVDLGPEAEARLRARFARAGAPFPPRRAHLLAFKSERRLELWAESAGGRRKVHAYPILGTSGTAGPKLREGDEQIPEGIYRVTWLHPNSSYHLSMKLDYPNAFDREQAAREGRTRLGGDIFIHGSDVSIGCLAMGDPAIEELFVLAARIGREDLTVVIAPWDLRVKPVPATEKIAGGRPWLAQLYAQLATTLARFR